MKKTPGLSARALRALNRMLAKSLQMVGAPTDPSTPVKARTVEAESASHRAASAQPTTA